MFTLAWNVMKRSVHEFICSVIPMAHESLVWLMIYISYSECINTKYTNAKILFEASISPIIFFDTPLTLPVIVPSTIDPRNHAPTQQYCSWRKPSPCSAPQQSSEEKRPGRQQNWAKLLRFWTFLPSWLGNWLVTTLFVCVFQIDSGFWGLD